jgi:hypothetical protein
LFILLKSLEPGQGRLFWARFVAAEPSIESKHGSLMNSHKQPQSRTPSVVFLVALAAFWIVQPSLCSAGGKRNQWSAKYVAGTKRSNQGAKLDLVISNQEVTGKKGKNVVLEIPAANISEVGYDTSSHNRGWTWLKAGADVATEGKCTGSEYCGASEAFILTPVLVGAAVMSPFHSTQHFVRILWQDSGVPSEVLFEVGKDDYSAVLSALQNLTGKPWQDMQEARRKLIGEIESAKGRSSAVQVDRTVVLNEAEMRSGNYQLVLLERPGNLGEAYFFSGSEVKPEHVTAQAVVRVEASTAQTTGPKVTYVEQMGVQTVATIQFPDKKLVFDSSGLPARVAHSDRRFYGGSDKWATVIRTDYKGESALRFHVIHSALGLLPHICHEYVYVTQNRVASEIAPNSPQSGCATFSALRAEVKVVASQGKWTNHFLDVTVEGKSYNLQPILEEGNGGGKKAGLGKSRDAAREWATFFAHAVTDFDAVERGSQTPPNP